MMGETSPLKAVKRRNATTLFESHSIPLGPFLIDFKEHLEYIEWIGILYERYIDSLKVPQSQKLLSRSNDEIHLQSHFGIQYKSDIVSCGSDILMGTIVRYKNFFIDPGLWCSIARTNGSIDFSVGIVSSYPDIRGLPDKFYRKTINKTYMATLRLKHHLFNRSTTISLEPYIRRRDLCPAVSFDYRFHVWVDTLETPLYSGGINCRLSFVKEYFCDIEIAGTVGKSHRIVDDKRKEYEWDIPWSIKSFIRFHFLKNQMHLSLNAIISPGIPYRDIADNNKLKEPNSAYIRPDFSFEYHARNIRHRFITRYDLYLGIQNFINRENSVEPYWDSRMTENPIRLIPFTFYMGGRFAFRM